VAFCRVLATNVCYRLQVLQTSDKDKNSTMLAQKIFCFARKILKQRSLAKGSGRESARVGFKAPPRANFLENTSFFANLAACSNQRC
jgi:hypothetical protein